MAANADNFSETLGEAEGFDLRMRVRHAVWNSTKGILLARCRPGESLVPVTMRLAQAALRISDLWFIFRIRSVESIADEVADFLTERQLPFDRREKRAGSIGAQLDGGFPCSPA